MVGKWLDTTRLLGAHRYHKMCPRGDKGKPFYWLEALRGIATDALHHFEIESRECGEFPG
ncbi:hypothetical protein GCM10027040_16330 [Halomonas shantousis]